MGPQRPHTNCRSDRRVLVKPPRQGTQTACRTATSLPNRPAGTQTAFRTATSSPNRPARGHKLPFGPQRPRQTAPRGDTNCLSDRNVLAKPPRGETQTAFRTATSLPNRPAGGEGAPHPPPHTLPSKPARLLPRALSRLPRPPAGSQSRLGLPPGASQGRLGLSKAAWGRPRPPGAFQGRLGLPRAACGFPGSPGVPSSRLGPPKASRGFPEPPGASQGCLRPFRTAWGHPEPPGATQGRRGPPSAACELPRPLAETPSRLGPPKAACASQGLPKAIKGKAYKAFPSLLQGFQGPVAPIAHRVSGAFKGPQRALGDLPAWEPKAPAPISPDRPSERCLAGKRGR